MRIGERVRCKATDNRGQIVTVMVDWFGVRWDGPNKRVLVYTKDEIEVIRAHKVENKL